METAETTIRAEKIGTQAYQELHQRHRSYVCLFGPALCLPGVSVPVVDGGN